MSTFDTLIGCDTLTRFDTLILQSSAGSEPTRIIEEVKIRHGNKNSYSRKETYPL